MPNVERLPNTIEIEMSCALCTLSSVFLKCNLEKGKIFYWLLLLHEIRFLEKLSHDVKKSHTFACFRIESMTAL